METGHQGVRNKVISCANISKEYGDKKVLSPMDFDVFENEFVVILGPGQSGKTTLFRMIAGFEAPTTGTVSVKDHVVQGPEQDVGYVFQRYMLFPWRTVMGNVKMGPMIAGKSKEEQNKESQKYIDLVGLTGFEKSYPHQLSGGMKQRVGIARAYVNNRNILLLDEPFGQLDAQTRILMEQEIERIWQEDKRTIVFVTSNVDEAVYLADRLIVLDGKLPSHLSNVYEIDLPRPRNLTSLEFLKIRQMVTDNMSLVL